MAESMDLEVVILWNCEAEAILKRSHPHVQRVGDFEFLSPKWDVCIKSLPQGSGTYAEEEVERLLEAEVVDDSKETVSSRHNRTNAHTNAQRLEASQVKAAQGPSWEGVVDTGFHS